jgi:hypothetical protein
VSRSLRANLLFRPRNYKFSALTAMARSSQMMLAHFDKHR